MATRSTISVMQKDGTIQSIYCHNDGYLEHVGNILQTNYNSFEQANAIIALGSLSVLAENLTPLPQAKPRYKWRYSEGTLLDEHTYDDPQEGVTIAYHRDRGEKFRKPAHFQSLLELESCVDFLQGYNYLFMGDKWVVKTLCTTSFIPLDEAMLIDLED